MFQARSNQLFLNRELWSPQAASEPREPHLHGSVLPSIWPLIPRYSWYSFLIHSSFHFFITIVTTIVTIISHHSLHAGRENPQPIQSSAHTPEASKQQRFHRSGSRSSLTLLVLVAHLTYILAHRMSSLCNLHFYNLGIYCIVW